MVGHYTQIVWKQTTQVGASRLIIETSSNLGPMRYVVVFANYNPPGNFRGKPPF